MHRNTYYGLGLALAVASTLFLVLAIGALGIIGDGGPPDRLYAAVLAVGIVGTLLSRLRSRGMALTLLAMAGTQALLGVVALVATLMSLEEFDGASIVDLIGLNAMYVVLFCASGWLFLRSSTATGPAAAGLRPRQ